MLLKYPNNSPEICEIYLLLYEEHRLYREAIIQDAKLWIKKEIRLRIRELERQLAAIKIINLELEKTLQ